MGSSRHGFKHLRTSAPGGRRVSPSDHGGFTTGSPKNGPETTEFTTFRLSAPGTRVALAIHGRGPRGTNARLRKGFSNEKSVETDGASRGRRVNARGSRGCPRLRHRGEHGGDRGRAGGLSRPGA